MRRARRLSTDAAEMLVCQRQRPQIKRPRRAFGFHLPKLATEWLFIYIFISPQMVDNKQYEEKNKKINKNKNLTNQQQR